MFTECFTLFTIPCEWPNRKIVCLNVDFDVGNATSRNNSISENTLTFVYYECFPIKIFCSNPFKSNGFFRRASENKGKIKKLLFISNLFYGIIYFSRMLCETGKHVRARGWFNIFFCEFNKVFPRFAIII